ncbi:peptide ABC transporter ATP-binding protein [Sphaerisporangium siamense]|uniref:ABC-type polar-amino-acid transporter n=1 Tax=Sphaerisporangium siamense TaxID=795645 RepID=A0A7W7D431_9ACTN|nr:amino acid ABC transporter ATP-binding protein [Sphaerisporangium siamense]MBB4699604.1 polar amino acid transport system ATP-binding protein [Sphaerisporangium siamense]GII87018.1 peptide ABC transporter ATP-binding protein [Sphaerisporangium siamense]
MSETETARRGAGSETGRPPLIRIRNLHKRFGDNEVLRGVDLDVREGEVVTIIGPSGSGKSTLLRCVNLLEIPTSGEVHVLGQQINAKGARLDRIRREIGMVFQQFNLFPHMTVLANVIEGQRTVQRKSAREAEETARRMLAKVGLEHKADAKPRQLSGGQQQRVAIARALAMNPKIMLFDEPTSALDPELRAEVLDTMRELAAEGMTMIIVTHEMGFARRVADRAVFIDGGLIVEDGPPGVILRRPETERLHQFLNVLLWGEDA